MYYLYDFQDQDQDHHIYPPQSKQRVLHFAVEEPRCLELLLRRSSICVGVGPNNGIIFQADERTWMFAGLSGLVAYFVHESAKAVGPVYGHEDYQPCNDDG